MSSADVRRADEAAQVAAEIQKMGATFDDDVLRRTYALYVPLQQRAPREGVIAHRDLAYGPDSRHFLDVFTCASGATALAPVVLFLHGGGYVGGERSPVSGLIYDNVPTFFARHGMVGVNATYRLAPEHKWPSGGEDVGRIVGWLQENVHRFGGDPARIFLVGHSAGATHAATWTFMQSVHGTNGPRVAGTILISGVYAALHAQYSQEQPRSNQFAYYGDDTSSWAGMAPFAHITPGHPPVYIVVSEHEPYYFVWPSVALLDALVRCDHRMPGFRVLRNHNHVSSALQINSEIDDLGADLLSFISSVSMRGALG